MIVKFEENECFRFDVPKINNSLVYFLLYNEEVVYVGQTVQGLVRPLSHKDKVFDSVAVISVPEDLLTAVEDYYISKYTPKYNKTMRMYLPMLVARNRIREIIGNDSYTVRDVKKDAFDNGISLTVLGNGNVYISQEEFKKLCLLLHGNDEGE